MRLLPIKRKLSKWIVYFCNIEVKTDEANVVLNNSEGLLISRANTKLLISHFIQIDSKNSK